MMRRASAIPLPPYSYVPGHEHPHPVTDPRGHSHDPASRRDSGDSPSAARTSIDSVPLHADRAAGLPADAHWLHATDLFKEGFYWEAHEAWEHFWNGLGRTSPEARFVQGLIHLAAAAVKIREGNQAGVTSHTKRARQLVGGWLDVPPDTAGAGSTGVANRGGLVTAATFGLAAHSLAEVLAELEAYTPACWHTARAPVVRVLASGLKRAEGTEAGGHRPAGHAGGMADG